jgi:N utilization substance protein A
MIIVLIQWVHVLVCVVRIQAVQQELNGGVLMLLYGLMILQYIASALEPADVSGIVIDEEERTADIIFATSDQLARAIGSKVKTYV